MKEVLKSTQLRDVNKLHNLLFCLERGGLQSYVVRAHVKLAIQKLNNLMIPYMLSLRSTFVQKRTVNVC